VSEQMLGRVCVECIIDISDSFRNELTALSI
jgi:hypothetical protein